MPYIPDEDRPPIDALVEPLVAQLASTGHVDGELNYAISKLMHEWILSRPTGLRYTAAKEVEAALQEASKEFYRVVTGPYEDVKRIQNGPVSALDVPLKLRV